MNQEAHDILVDASLKGIPKCKNILAVGPARCVQGVLLEAAGVAVCGPEAGTIKWVNKAVKVFTDFGIVRSFVPCPHGCSEKFTEMGLMLHLNNDHDDDFLDIARKLLVVDPTTA